MRISVVCLTVFLGWQGSPAHGQTRAPADGKPWSAAVVVSGSAPLLHTEQILPQRADGSFAATVEDQVDDLFRRLASHLKDNGADFDRVVKLNFYVAKADAVAAIENYLRTLPASKPAVSFVVTASPAANALVAVDAVAALPALANPVAVKRSPHSAILPSGTRLFISGQAESGTLEEATRGTLESLRATLKFLSAKEADVVQVKAFVQPMAQAALVRAEIAKFFGSNPPPVSLVEWKSTLPIEIELVAWAGRERTGEPLDFLTPPGMKASPVYSRVARVNYGKLIYVSGLYGRGGLPAEIPDIFHNLKAILAPLDSDLRHLAKATYYVSSADAVKAMGEIRPRYYDPQRPPAASLAVVAGTGRAGSVTLDMIAVPSPRIRPNEYGPPEYGHGLSEADALAGWISLFDGKTTYGWNDAQVQNGRLTKGATTVVFGPCELKAEVDTAGALVIGGQVQRVNSGRFTLASTGKAAPIRLDSASVRSMLVRPLDLKPLFSGKDLSGWKAVPHPKLKGPPVTFNVSDGMLHVVGGPGALEYTDKPYGDLVVQLEARTHMRYSNSGLFIRSIPDSFMNGYEAQIYHRCHDGDVSTPFTWATGAIDDRQNARRLVSRDEHFFVSTVMARGPHIATWVNGYQTTDWIDTRAPSANPRQGLRLEAGAIQLQAHDAGTDVIFRRIAAAAW